MPTFALIQQPALAIDYSAVAETTAPADVYAAWAAEIGVSSTTTLSAISGDDAGYPLVFAASALPGGSSQGYFSSEGGIGLYLNAPSSTASTAYTLTGVSRHYGLASRPLVVATWHPANDLQSSAAKWQQAGGVTILYAQHQAYNGTTYQARIACRIESARIDLVVQAIDQPVPVMLHELMHPSTTTTLRQQATVVTVAAGSTQRVSLAIPTGPSAARATLASPLGALRGLAMPTGSAQAVLPSPIGAVTGFIIPPVLARAGLASPLSPSVSLVILRRAVRAALASPLGAAAALGALPASVWLALPSPLGRAAGLVGQTPAALAVLRSPLGLVAGAVAVGVQALAGLPSPIGALGARATQPRPAVMAVAGAAPQRLFADPLPLRDGVDVPEYAATGPLPWVYGRVTLAPRRWDAEGLVWLVADHPIVGVTAVRIDGVVASGWELAQVLDATGVAVALLRLTRPTTGALSVDVLGRRNERTGALLESPGEIATDVLARCGHVVSTGTWASLDRAALGVRLGGVIDQPGTLRAALTAIISAAGARWSAAPLRAWWPSDGATVATITPALADRVSASADTGSLATRVRVPWGWDWAAKAPRGTVIVESPEAVRRYGRIDLEVAAPWLRTARDALALATAALQEAARPRWDIEVAVGPGARWHPGDRLLLAHPWLPVGLATISAIRWSEFERVVKATLPAGPVPRVVTVGTHALAVAAATDLLQVAYRDGVASFRIADDAGAPLAGAAVTLDDQSMAFTDRSGRVQFRAGRGTHTLRVVADGYVTMLLDVTV